MSIDLGVVSTPVIQHAINRLDARRRHVHRRQPQLGRVERAEVPGRRGSYLSTAEAGELLDIYHLRSSRLPSGTGIGKLPH